MKRATGAIGAPLSIAGRVRSNPAIKALLEAVRCFKELISEQEPKAGAARDSGGGPRILHQNLGEELRSAECRIGRHVPLDRETGRGKREELAHKRLHQAIPSPGLRNAAGGLSQEDQRQSVGPKRNQVPPAEQAV